MKLLSAAALCFALAGASCTAPRPTEFVNITFTPSVDTSGYETWAFDTGRCVDAGDGALDDLVRKLLFAEIELALSERGYVHSADGAVDFLVWYEIVLEPVGGPELVAERTRSKIFIRDVETNRAVWRGERKAMLGSSMTSAELQHGVRAFVQELLEYTTKLRRGRSS